MLVRSGYRCRSVGYIVEMSGRARIVLVTCWVIVAGLLVRMAWGGNALGVLYVVRVSDPATLLVGAFSVLLGGGVTFGLVIRPSRGTLWVSTGLSLVVIPLSLVLAGDGHGSAGAVGVAAAVALAIAIRSLGRKPELGVDEIVAPGRPDTGDH